MAIGGSGKGIQIVVGTDYKDRDLKRAQRDLDKLKGQAAKSAGPMARLGNTIRANLGPALAMAGAAAAAFAVKLGVDGIKAAIADQKTVAVLAQTLRNLGEAHRQAGVEEFIAGLEGATGVADEELRPALGLLLQATGDVDEAQRRLQQAMDLSIGTGQSLDGVTRALARSLATGSKGSLTRYGIIIDDNTLKTEGFGAALDDAAEKFAGMAENEAKTLEGQLRILATEFDNVKESFGYGFLSGIGDTTDGIGDMTELMIDLKPIMYDLGEQIGTLVKAMSDLNDATGLVSAVFKGLTDVTGPTTDAILYFYRVLGQGEDPIEAAKQQLFGLGDGYDDAAGAAGRLSSGLGGGDWVSTAINDFDALNDEIGETGDELKTLNDELKTFFGFIDDRDAVRGYEAAIDALRKSLKENGKTFDINTEAGRDNEAALDAVFQNALKVAEGQATAAEKIDTMKSAAADAAKQLDKTKMSDAAKAALLQPFDDAILKFQDATTFAGNLKAAMEAIPTRVDINVHTSYTSSGVPGQYEGKPVPRTQAFGGYIDGKGGSRADNIPAMLSAGEFVIQAPAVAKFGRGLFAALNQGVNPLAGMTPTSPSRGSGFQIGTINVVAAPGERAETSLPRALRRASFLAGVNG